MNVAEDTGGERLKCTIDWIGSGEEWNFNLHERMEDVVSETDSKVLGCVESIYNVHGCTCFKHSWQEG